MLDMDDGVMAEIVPGMNVQKPDGDLGGEANQTPVLQPQFEESGTVPKKKGYGRPKEVSPRLMDSRRMMILLRLIRILLTMEMMISLMMH